MKIFIIVILSILALLFIAYITNADGKLVEKTYNSLIKYHDGKDIEEKI